MLATLLSAIALAACGGGGGAEAGELIATAAAGSATASTIGSAGSAGTTASTNAANATTASAANGTTATTGTTAASSAAASGVGIGATAAATSGGADATAVNTAASPAATGLTLRYTLARPQTTSAGVYDAAGVLVRTLWRGASEAAGAQTHSWDQTDDNGKPLPAGNYTVKVVHHNLNYVWDGVVGNSSATAGSATLHKSLNVPTSLATIDGGIEYAVGYNEGQSQFNGFTLARPQLNQSPVRNVDPFTSGLMIASDRQRLYWVNGGGLSSRTFVAAFDLASGAQSVFTAGSPLCLNLMGDGKTCYPSQSYRSVLESRTDNSDTPVGIAVQRGGAILAVAYAGEGNIRLYDKTSGQLVGKLAVVLNAKALNQIAFSPAGDLWVIAGTRLLRYTNVATNPTPVATVSGLAHPLAVTVDPGNEDGVWLADGGSAQQLLRFDRNGHATATLGRSGGCTGQASVSASTLCFIDSPTSEHTALAVDDNQVLWVIDSGNNRLLGYAANGSLATQIAYLPAVYAATVDTGNPTRVFANYLEFAVDYGKSLSDPAAWTLVRNWLPALKASMRDANSTNNGFGGFRAVQTMSNGRTYGLLSVNKVDQLVELQAGGQLRASTPLRPAGAGESGIVLYENGDLGYASTVGSTQTVMRMPLQGFDSAGNPIWPANATAVASAPISATAPAYANGTWTGVTAARFPITSSGMVIWFNPSVDAGSGYHLGAAAQGSSRWAWQASPSAALDGLGSFQTRKVDNRVQYGGNLVYANGRSVVYGYHGEGFTDQQNGGVGQANQFMHYRDDGLFLGQFGVATTRATRNPQPGMAGNAFSPTLVRVSGELYLYCNDESAWGGVHRWHLAGEGGIEEFTGSAATGGSVTLQ